MVDIYEEPTQENLKALIDKIPYSLRPVERLILCNESTNQALLSVLFLVPIKVEIISQIDFANVIIRWSKLIAEFDSDNIQTVCLAESVIDKNTSYSGFINGIREKKMGIGQIISALNIITKRNLNGFYCDSNIFSRTYTLTLNSIDDNLNIVITEIFPKELYKKL